MPIFMDTGGGDIYAAETKEQCLEAMRKDDCFKDYEESEAFEVDGSKAMMVEGDGDNPSYESTLAAEYVNLGYGYCIASTNC